jgi:hypothetical protein
MQWGSGGGSLKILAFEILQYCVTVTSQRNSCVHIESGEHIEKGGRGESKKIQGHDQGI